jgi:hypothetical protein
MRRVKFDHVIENFKEFVELPDSVHVGDPVEEERPYFLLKVLHFFAVVGERAQQVDSGRHILGVVVVLDEAEELCAHHVDFVKLALDHLLKESESGVSHLGGVLPQEHVLDAVPQFLHTVLERSV